MLISMSEFWKRLECFQDFGKSSLKGAYDLLMPIINLLLLIEAFQLVILDRVIEAATVSVL